MFARLVFDVLSLTNTVLDHCSSQRLEWILSTRRPDVEPVRVEHGLQATVRKTSVTDDKLRLPISAYADARAPRSAALYDDEVTARTDGHVLERVRRVKRIRRSPYYGRAERKYFDEDGKPMFFDHKGNLRTAYMFEDLVQSEAKPISAKPISTSTASTTTVAPLVFYKDDASQYFILYNDQLLRIDADKKMHIHSASDPAYSEQVKFLKQCNKTGQRRRRRSAESADTSADETDMLADILSNIIATDDIAGAFEGEPTASTTDESVYRFSRRRRSVEKVEKPAEKPAEEPAEKPTEKPAEKPAEEPPEKPTEQSTEKSVERSTTEKPVEKPLARKHGQQSEQSEQKLESQPEEKKVVQNEPRSSSSSLNNSPNGPNGESLSKSVSDAAVSATEKPKAGQESDDAKVRERKRRRHRKRDRRQKNVGAAANDGVTVAPTTESSSLSDPIQTGGNFSFDHIFDQLIDWLSGTDVANASLPAKPRRPARERVAESSEAKRE